MAPIRDWTGAITISPLPYCEIAAVGIWCGDLPQPTLRGSALRLCGRLFPYLGRALCVGVFLNERVVEGEREKSLCDMVVEWEKVCNFAVSIWCCAY